MRRLLAALTLLLLTGTLTAQTISEEVAIDHARAFFVGRQHTELSADLQEAYYVVQPADGSQGFVIVAADERQYPILGYSPSGHFDLNHLEESERGWLNHYATELHSLTQNHRTHHGIKWLPDLPARPEGVAPLTTTLWNQHKPYNLLCPNPEGHETPCVTGCVATALAQLMRYHRYPDRYDWGHMLDQYDNDLENYTEVESNAVALLMWQCGEAVATKYGYKSSAADGNSPYEALVEQFGYDRDLAYKHTQNGIDQEWHRLLLHELNQHRPLIYSVLNHCFLIDGYQLHTGIDAPFYHMNLGWGQQTSDRYYLLSSVADPTSSAGILHEMIYDVKPEDGIALPHFEMTKVSDLPQTVRKQHTPPTTVTFHLNCQSNFSFTGQNEPLSGSLQLVAYSQEGLLTEVGRWSLSNVSALTQVAVTLDLAGTLPIGRHSLEWRYYGAGDDEQYTLVATPQRMVVVYEQIPQLTVTLSEPPATIQGADHTISFTATNLGSETYYGTLIEVLTSREGLSCQVSSDPLTLKPGESVQSTFRGPIDDLPGGEATYKVMDSYEHAVLRNEQGERVEMWMLAIPRTPDLRFYDISLIDRQYHPTTDRVTSEQMYLEYVYERGSHPFVGKLALVVIDEADQVQEVLWTTRQQTIEPQAEPTSLGVALQETETTRDKFYRGKLTDGEYRVWVAAQQHNAGNWQLPPHADGETATPRLPLRIEKTRVVLGDEETGTIELKRLTKKSR